MENSQMVVATKYRLLEPQSLKDGSYNVNGSKKDLGTKVVLRSFVEERNSQKNNELYVINEVATVKFYEQREKNIEDNKAREQKEKVSNADLVDALVKNISAKSESKPKKEEKPKEEKKEEISSFSELSNEEIQEQLKAKGVEFHHKAGRSKLIELLTNNQ